MILLVMRVIKVEAPLEGMAVAVIVDAIVHNMDSFKDVEVKQGHGLTDLTTAHGVGEVEDLQVLTKTGHPVVDVEATMMEKIFQGNCLNNSPQHSTQSSCRAEMHITLKVVVCSRISSHMIA
jgi:hypothetical protein